MVQRSVSQALDRCFEYFESVVENVLSVEFILSRMCFL